MQLVLSELYPAVGRAVYLAHLMDEGSNWVEGNPSASLLASSTLVPVTPGFVNFSQQRSQRSGRAVGELIDLRTYFEEVIAILESEIGG